MFFIGILLKNPKRYSWPRCLGFFISVNAYNITTVLGICVNVVVQILEDFRTRLIASLRGGGASEI